MRFAFIFACALSVTTGCSMFMNSMEKPTAEVRSLSLSAAGFGGVAGRMNVDVMNPNAFGLPLQGVKWKLSVGGSRAVSGHSDLNETIPAKGVAPIVTTLSIGAGDAIAVGTALASGARDYQVDATFTFSTKFGPLSVDVHTNGTLGS